MMCVPALLMAIAVVITVQFGDADVNTKVAVSLAGGVGMLLAGGLLMAPKHHRR